MSIWPHPTVMTMTYLFGLGYSYDLIKRYIKSNWILSMGNGAYIKSNSNVSWVGGIYALQKQLKLKLHIGGLSALNLNGFFQYVPQGKFKLSIFATQKTNLPTWFKKHDWGVHLSFFTTNLFGMHHNLGMNEYTENQVVIHISSRERAILELLYLVPRKQSFEHSQELFEGLVSLRPDLLQELLEKCTSYKVKRLFLYFAEKYSYPWFSKLELEKIELGKGKRSIVKNGIYDQKYKITVAPDNESDYAI